MLVFIEFSMSNPDVSPRKELKNSGAGGEDM